VQLGLGDEVAHSKLDFNPLASNATKEQMEIAAMYHVLVVARGVSPTWARSEFLRELWGTKPIVLKGIRCVGITVSSVS
jgi:lactate 2-monooxygenase